MTDPAVRQDPSERERKLRHRIDGLRHMLDLRQTELEAKHAEIERLREALIHSGGALAAAISLLEHGPKTAAPSDKMFDQMLIDYNKALDTARATLKESNYHDNRFISPIHGA